MEDWTEKPMADIMVAKKSGRYNGLEGHTARKGCKCSYCFEQLAAPPVILRDKECKVQGNTFGYLSEALEKDDFGVPLSRLEQPFCVTAFELSGLDTSHSLDRNNAWEDAPALLAQHSVVPPMQRTLPNGSLQTTFELEPLGEFLPSNAVAAAQRDLQFRIYQIQRHRPRLWVKLAEEAPEGVEDGLLKATLRCRVGKVPSSAVVRCNNHGQAWDVAGGGGHPLDIDLGGTCVVSHFSTQGRHPLTRRYPHVYTDTITKVRHVEDEEYNSFNVRAGQRYNGPWWTVKFEKGESAAASRYWRCSKWLDPQWVCKYELWARGEEQGSTWSSVGVFVGNSDATTEVAHAFSSVKGGLRARYLRVVPLETEGGGALRVGVYGKAVKQAEGTRKQAAARGGGKAAVGDEESELVRYTLTMGQVSVGRANRNTRYARNRAPHGNGGYRDKDLERQKWLSVGMEAREETKEFEWERGNTNEEEEEEEDNVLFVRRETRVSLLESATVRSCASAE